MTCSFLTRTGYAGQRYEVSCLGFYESDPTQRKVVGWTNRADGGSLVRMIEAHPVWNSPEVKDLGQEAEKP
jgi:hypothetical protein